MMAKESGHWNAEDVDKAFDERPLYGLFITLAESRTGNTRGIRVRRVTRNGEAAPQVWRWSTHVLPKALWDDIAAYVDAHLREEIYIRWGIGEELPF